MNSKEAKIRRHQRARHCAIRKQRDRQRWEAIERDREAVRKRRFDNSDDSSRHYFIDKPVTERNKLRGPSVMEFFESTTPTFVYIDEDELFGEIDIFLEDASRNKGVTQHELTLVAR